MLSPVILVPAVLNGLMTGAIYALIALGLTLIYGVLHIINFAHGALLTAAMFAAFFAYHWLGIDPYLAAIGLTPSQVGLLLGISSTGALLARAATPIFVRRIPTLRLTVIATAVAAGCLVVLAVSDDLVPMILAMSVLGFALGLSQTTTMDWVVNLVDDTSRGSALGLRVATNRLGQTIILALAGVISGWLGVQMAFVLLAAVMLVTAGSGLVSERRDPDQATG
jgi:branched-subunit amino acid ABC-type transport system permease component